MEPNVIVYPPNRPMDRTMEPSKVPVLYKNLFFIDANSNGGIIVGCANIAGTYWEGTLFYYKHVVDAEENKYSGYFISNSTISDGKFLKNSDLILLAEDSGELKLLSLPNGEERQPLGHCDSMQNGYRMEQIAVWNTDKAVACYENTVALYDLSNNNSIRPSSIYQNYHTDQITSVDTNKLKSSLFTSTSVDRRVCIWDDRITMPAVVLYTNEFSSLTSVSWNPSNSDNIVVGSEAGDIYLLDLKQPKEFVDVSHCFNNSVHRLLFNSSENLAVCGDNQRILVYNCKGGTFNKVYENSDHCDTVRGLTWHKNYLYSCGFDKKIISHTL